MKTEARPRDVKFARTGSVEKPRTADVLMKSKLRIRGPMRNE